MSLLLTNYFLSFFPESAVFYGCLTWRPGLDTISFVFCFLFVKNHSKSINDPSTGKHCFSSVPPSNSLVSVSKPIKGFFELTRRPSRALDSPLALLLELQRYKDTVRCAVLGAVVPRHLQQQLTQTLIVFLLKTYFLTPIPDSEKSTE